MTMVQDVICLALRFANRQSAATNLENGTMTDEEQNAVNTMLHCYNAIENELARTYFPLVKKEELTLTDGKIYYSELTYAPVKILGITSKNKPVKYRLTPTYAQTNAKNVTVEYSYCPDKKDIDGECEVALKVGESLLAYGVLAEYYLILGNTDESEEWERKYRDAADVARSLAPLKRYIPARRWV